MVDAFHFGGWWPGVIAGCGKGCRFLMVFGHTNEKHEVCQQDLRFHHDWVDGKWIRPIQQPQQNTALQLGSSAAAKDNTIKGRDDATDNLEIFESRGDMSQPAKKLKTKNYVAEALDNQRFPRPLVSCKTEGPNKSFSVNLDCSTAEIAPSTNSDCSELGDTGKVVDSELNEEDMGTVVDVGILAAEMPRVHSPKRTGEKDGPLSDPTARIVEDSSKESIADLTTPEPSLVLPFKKCSAFWKVIESMEIFAKFPQHPHFSPLAEYEEEKREEVALQKMVKYGCVGDKILKLTTDDLKTSAVIYDILESLEELEECGFDVTLIKHYLNDLRLKKEKQARLQNELEEIDDMMNECNVEKAKIATKIKDLEKELKSAKSRIQAKHEEVTVLRSEESVTRDEILRVNRNFEETATFLKQIFR